MIDRYKVIKADQLELIRQRDRIESLVSDTVEMLNADQLEMIRQRDRIESLERIVDHMEKLIKEKLKYSKIFLRRL